MSKNWGQARLTRVPACPGSAARRLMPGTVLLIARTPLALGEAMATVSKAALPLRWWFTNPGHSYSATFTFQLYYYLDNIFVHV